MNRQEILELWTAYLDEQSSSEQDTVLEQQLERDAAMREFVVRDLEIEGLLQSLGRAKATEETFVSSVMGQLSAEESEIEDDTARSQQFISHEITSPPVMPPPLPPPVQNPASPLPLAGECQTVPAPPVAIPTGPAPEPAIGPDFFGENAKTRRRASSGGRPRRRRNWGPLMTTAAAVLLVVSLGVGALVVSNRSPVADSTNGPAGNQAQSTVPPDRLDPESPDPESPDPEGPDPLRSDPGDGPAVSRPGGSLSPPPPWVPGDNVAADDDDRPGESEAPATTPRQDGSEIRPGPLMAGDPSPSSGSSTDPFPSEAVVRGRIVDQSGADWSSPAPTEIHNQLLRLSNGVVTIALTDGASIQVRGPAELKLDSPNRVTLERGDLAAAVPPAAIGFTVSTPSARVVDLGTEFRVLVSDGGDTAVRVERGRVEMSSAPDANDADTWQLEAGDYKWVSGDGRRNLDWSLRLSVADDAVQGSLDLNGRLFRFASTAEFLPLYARAYQELADLRRLVSSDRSRRGESPFRAEIAINDQVSTITTAEEYRRAYPDVHRKLQELLTGSISRGAGGANRAFGGSFNINGEEIRIDAVDDLLKLQDQLRDRVFGGFHGGIDQPNDRPVDGGARRDAEANGPGAAVPRNPRRDTVVPNPFEQGLVPRSPDAGDNSPNTPSGITVPGQQVSINQVSIN